jgi:serine/threonine protein kinase
VLQGVPLYEGDDPDVCLPGSERIAAKLAALLAEVARGAGAAERVDSGPGDTIARFELVRELGRGGFGAVYEAVDRELGGRVALKIVKPRPGMASRGVEWVMCEAEAVGRLHHPHIVSLLDFGRGPSGPYLVFELLRGRSLAEHLRSGPLSVESAIRVGVAVSRALVHAHAAGVVHRDLTASNINLGDDGTVKVLDFGLAHLFGPDRLGEGGTPLYMAPEQWEGEPGDARTDLFSLGVILFQALSGEYPYPIVKGWSEALEPGETPELPRAAAPRPLRELVRTLIHRAPEARPGSARALRDEFLSLATTLQRWR